ncbi:MAG: NAD(P)/FAD-dependent oxidoreductase [Verrucomicrobiales bacterium]|nr:NAD(P)/FAD-dependent oxidoreductase [Verrucomicrobiales bacterium]
MRSTGEIQPSEGKAARGWSRRDFAKSLTLAGAGVLSGCAGLGGGGGRLAVKAPKGAVAIVGGGVAGLTAAWRLHQRGVEVHLYEAAARMGGRMWTKKNFNEDGMFCELGGELVDTGHKALIRLAKELGVGVQHLKTGAETGSDYYVLNGRIRTDADLIPAFAPLAKRIAADAEGLYDKKGEFTAKARALDQVPLDRYLNEAGWATGTEPWLIKILDIAYVTEYGLDTRLQSALNFVDFISPDTSEGLKLYGDSDEAWRVEGGSGALPDALVRRLEGHAALHAGHRLNRIEDDGKEIALTFDHGRETKRVSYGRVILTMPFSVLRHISGVDRLALSAPKRKAIQELGFGENAKVMLSFREKFWHKLTPANQGGAFSDGLWQTWNASAGQRGSRGILTCYIGGAAARKFSSGSAPGYLKQISEVFPEARTAYDGHMASMDWTHFAFAKGSFSAPLVGQYCGMIADGATPELGGRLHFAGEHTSEESPGFMDGGVDSGERAARELLAVAEAAA